MKTHQYVQVPPDNAAGKKIRNLETVVGKADGSEHTVQTQVVSLDKESSTVIDVLYDILDCLTEIRTELQVLTYTDMRSRTGQPQARRSERRSA